MANERLQAILAEMLAAAGEKPPEYLEALADLAQEPDPEEPPDEGPEEDEFTYPGAPDRAAQYRREFIHRKLKEARAEGG